MQDLNFIIDRVDKSNNVICKNNLEHIQTIEIYNLSFFENLPLIYTLYI